MKKENLKIAYVGYRTPFLFYLRKNDLKEDEYILVAHSNDLKGRFFKDVVWGYECFKLKDYVNIRKEM